MEIDERINQMIENAKININEKIWVDILEK